MHKRFCLLSSVTLAILACSVFSVCHADPIDTDGIDLEAKKVDRTGTAVTETNPRSSFEASHLLDGSLDDSHRWMTDTKTCEVVFAFPEEKVVDSVGLVSAAYSPGDRSPKDWRFYGSSDNANWTLLDTQVGQSGWNKNELRVYSFSNKTAYRYFKFEVLTNNGSGTTSLAEFWFYDIRLAHLAVESSEGVCFGTVTPLWGSTIQTPGEAVSCTAYESLDRDGDGKFVTTCKGYSYYVTDEDGALVLDRSGTEWTLSIAEFPQGDAKVVWNMETKVVASANVTGQGTVTGAGDYLYGSTATLVAEPAEGSVFRRWTGLPADVDALSPRVTVTMTNVVSVTAVFDNVASITRYVAPTGDDAAAGTAEAPYATVKHAIEALGANGGFVYLAAGEYAEAPILNEDGTVKGGDTIVVSTPVRIVGLTGDPADVVVTRANTSKNARVFLLDHAESGLSCLTVTGGKSDFGGNVQITSKGGTIEDCELTYGSNSSYLGGGGNLFMNAGRVSRCVIRNGSGQSNPQGRNGGGFWMDGGVIENSLVYSNAGRYAAGVVSGTSRLVNCTVVANRFNVADLSAGLYVTENARVVNSIIYGNTNTADSTLTGIVCALSAKAKMDEVFIACATAECETRLNDTCYFGPIGFTDFDNQDFTLSVSSPVRNLGVDPSAYGAVSEKDLAGNPRAEDGLVDLGCYEFAANGLSGDFTITAESCLASEAHPAELTLTASLEGAKGEVTYHWVMDDGVPDHRAEMTTNANSFVWSCAYAGTYTVTMEALDGTSSVTAEHTIRTAPPDLYVTTVNESALYPYETEATAATSIQEALAAAVDGSVIHVAVGAYTNSEEIAVTKNVTLIGADRNGTILVNCDGRNGRVISLSAADAIVANFSLEALGAAYYGEGGTVRISGAGGTLSNCLVKCHSVSGWGNGGAGIACQFGRVTHCEVYGSGSFSTGDAANNAMAVRLRNGSSMDNTLVRDITTIVNDGNWGHVVSAESGSSLVNCTIVNCKLGDPQPGKGTGHGFGLYVDASSSAKNCAIVGVKSNEITNRAPEGETTPVVTVVGEMTLTRPWSGVAANYDHCATDGETPINDTCKLAGTFDFAGYAVGNYAPVERGALYDAGTTEGLTVAATDLAGRPRILHKGLIDIGCFECRPRKGMALILR